MKRYGVRFVSLFLAWMMLLGTVPAYAGFPADKPSRVIPDCLRFSQKTEKTKLRTDCDQYVTLPKTALRSVTNEVTALVKSMLAEAKENLPKIRYEYKTKSVLDVGPMITRVGDRWMSFCVIARITQEGDQIYAAAQCRVYDMVTGRRVKLTDVLDEEAGGLEYASREARRQLEALYPSMTADEETLDALCAPEVLKNAEFALSPGHLTLIWPVRSLYPKGPASLMRVELYYRDMEAYMTAKGLEETDCTGYTLVALTYDDGPIILRSDKLMDQLRLYGAEVTFFVIGSYLKTRQGILHREYDAGHSVQSHNWVHDFPDVSPQLVAEWEQYSREAMEGIIGRGPDVMRAPGGKDYVFINMGSTLPLVHWSLATTDSVSDQEERKNIEGNTRKIYYNADDGEIVLMHDLNEVCDDLAASFLPRLEERNVLCVTLMDLVSLRGIELKPGTVLYNCREQPTGY